MEMGEALAFMTQYLSQPLWAKQPFSVQTEKQMCVKQEALTLYALYPSDRHQTTLVFQYNQWAGVCPIPNLDMLACVTVAYWERKHSLDGEWLHDEWQGERSFLQLSPQNFLLSGWCVSLSRAGKQTGAARVYANGDATLFDLPVVIDICWNMTLLCLGSRPREW